MQFTLQIPSIWLLSTTADWIPLPVVINDLLIVDSNNIFLVITLDFSARPCMVWPKANSPASLPIVSPYSSYHIYTGLPNVLQINQHCCFMAFAWSDVFASKTLFFQIFAWLSLSFPSCPPVNVTLERGPLWTMLFKIAPLFTYHFQSPYCFRDFHNMYYYLPVPHLSPLNEGRDYSSLFIFSFGRYIFSTYSSAWHILD